MQLANTREENEMKVMQMAAHTVWRIHIPVIELTFACIPMKTN